MILIQENRSNLHLRHQRIHLGLNETKNEEKYGAKRPVSLEFEGT